MGLTAIALSAYLQRIGYHGDAWVLQTREGGNWIDLYAFTLEPQYWIDYKVANH